MSDWLYFRGTAVKKTMDDDNEESSKGVVADKHQFTAAMGPEIPLCY